MKRIFAILLISCFFAGCSSNVIFEEKQDFPDLKWNNFKPITFKVDIKNTEDCYNISLNMRHIAAIPYNDLKVLIILTAPSGEIRSFQHIFQIKDKDGHLLGDKVGDVIDIENMVKEYFFFNEKGVYEFKIQNYTQYYDYTGIMNLGLKIEKTKFSHKME